MTTLKSILAGILVGASTLAGRAEVPKPYVETTFASDFVSPAGSTIKEQNRQDWASISHKGFTYGIWQCQFQGEKGIAERDHCFSYSRPVTSNLNASIGFQYWDYPNGRFGKFDSVETAGLDYSGLVNASLNYTRLNKTDVTDEGQRIHLKVSKSIPLVKGKTKLSLTPSVATAWLDDYYGYSGLSQVSEALSVGLSRGNWSLNIAGTHQESLDKDLPTLNWGTIGVGYQF